MPIFALTGIGSLTVQQNIFTMKLKFRRQSAPLRNMARSIFVLPAVLLWIWMGSVPQTSSMNPQGMLSQIYLAALIAWIVAPVFARKR